MSRRHLRSSVNPTTKPDNLALGKSPKPLPSTAARLATKLRQSSHFSSASQPNLNNHRPRQLSHRRPNAPSFHLSQSMPRQRIKPHIILLQLYPFPQSFPQFLIFTRRQHTFKHRILHPPSVPLQQIRHFLSSLIARNILTLPSPKGTGILASMSNLA